jgi:hypothetical protein
MAHFLDVELVGLRLLSSSHYMKSQRADGILCKNLLPHKKLAMTKRNNQEI